MYNAGRLLNSERTVLAVLDGTPAHEIDPTQLELPEGALKSFDNTGIHEVTSKSV